jgi:clan AA aspartic protease
MLRGAIRQFRPMVEFSVIGSDGRRATIPFVLDTGYSGTLALPEAFCEQLALVWDRSQPATLANGTSIIVDVYLGRMSWSGPEKIVEVLAVEGEPLVGLVALEGYRVCLDVAEGGSVIVEGMAE